MENGLLQVTQKSFGRFPVDCSQFVHVLGKFINCKGDVWPRQGEVLKASHDPLKFSIVHNNTAID